MRHSKRLNLIALALAASALPHLAQAAQPNPDRHIVKFAPGKSAAARAALTRAAARVALELPLHDAVAVELPAAALAGLARNPNIEYVEPDVVRYPMQFSSQIERIPYGIPMVQADKVPDTLAGNRKICIIDSGYDRGHEDLGAGSNVTGEFDSGTGWWYTDENHHGTHVAGTVAAIFNGLGVVGVAPNKLLKLHIVKVFGADGWAYSSTLTAAVDKCAAAGANVISMSLGGGASSRTEIAAFDKYYKRAGNSILSIAAAGNAGNTQVSYPAGYANVVSVAAVDENRAWATFSQYNKDVELAAPGVAVLSTVPMGTGRKSSLSVDRIYASAAMDGSPVGSSVGATLVDCGTGAAACIAAEGSKVCLIERGTNTFAEKVQNCHAGGGSAAVIYNNVAGMLYGTVDGGGTTIPSVGVSDLDGAILKTKTGNGATAAVNATNYAYFDGTSMATPHVSAVAALVWSHKTGCSAATVRNVLNATASDILPAGRDNKTGFGLVQARAATDRLLATACP